MKTLSISYKLHILFLAFWLLTGLATAAEIDVDDQRLEQCLRKLATEHQWKTPEEFLTIRCHSMGISSLAGLEKFHNIQALSLHNNKLSKIDINLERMPQLRKLNIARNRLENVSIGPSMALEEIYLFGNRIKNLSLNNLGNLRILKANSNKIETFHYSNLPKLEKIYIFNNKLEAFDIYDLPSMQYMDCRENPMPDKLYDEMDHMESVVFLHDGNAEDW